MSGHKNQKLLKHYPTVITKIFWQKLLQGKTIRKKVAAPFSKPISLFITTWEECEKQQLPCNSGTRLEVVLGSTWEIMMMLTQVRLMVTLIVWSTMLKKTRDKHRSQKGALTSVAAHLLELLQFTKYNRKKSRPQAVVLSRSTLTLLSTLPSLLITINMQIRRMMVSTKPVKSSSWVTLEHPAKAPSTERGQGQVITVSIHLSKTGKRVLILTTTKILDLILVIIALNQLLRAHRRE